MRTTNFDAIATSAPLNREASAVRDGSGDVWSVTVPPTQPRWFVCPPLKTDFETKVGAEMAKRMVGRRAGRMTVLGVWADGNPKKNATWVCRCDCGYFEGRKAKALNGPDAGKLACFECARLMHLQRRPSLNTNASRKAEEARLDAMARR